MARKTGFIIAIGLLVAVTAASTAPFIEGQSGADSVTLPEDVSATGEATAAEAAQAASSTVVDEKGVHSDMIVLTVDKSELKATLRTWPPDPAESRVLKTFRIATGKVEGDKQVEGDNKTPEGVYVAQEHIPDSRLPAKYGAGAIPLDFPNLFDRFQRKTGYGIWLHGVENDQRIEEAKVTEGCVAFYNSDIAQLSSWLKPFQGVIVIAPTLADVNRPDEVQRVRKLTERWMQAWAERNLDDYISYYDHEFRYQSHDKESYRRYKERVFKSYKEMVVNFADLRVITHPKYAVAMFNQDFRGDSRFVSNGRKVLYWVRRGPGEWKILAESFESRRFEFLTYTDAELALLSSTSSSNPSKKEPSASSL